MLAAMSPEVLLHFSEDPTITRFEPHVPATNPTHEPAVWAIDEQHSPVYWFPRDCPRGSVWANSEAERLVLARQEEQVRRTVHALHVLLLAEEVHAVGDARLARGGLRRRDLRAVAGEEEPRGDLRRDAREDADDVLDAFHFAEVRHVREHLLARRHEARAQRTLGPLMGYRSPGKRSKPAINSEICNGGGARTRRRSPRLTALVLGKRTVAMGPTVP